MTTLLQPTQHTQINNVHFRIIDVLEDEPEQKYKTIISLINSTDTRDQIIPVGSVLVSTALYKLYNNHLIYTRTWRLPYSIVLKGLNYLYGASTLSKIEILFTACQIPTEYIFLVENVTTQIVKVHFKNRYLTAYIKRIVTAYCNAHYSNNVIIVE